MNKIKEERRKENISRSAYEKETRKFIGIGFLDQLPSLSCCARRHSRAKSESYEMDWELWRAQKGEKSAGGYELIFTYETRNSGDLIADVDEKFISIVYFFVSCLSVWYSGWVWECQVSHMQSSHISSLLTYCCIRIDFIHKRANRLISSTFQFRVHLCTRCGLLSICRWCG